MSDPLTTQPKLTGESSITERIRRIEDELRALRLLPGTGYTINKTANGQSLVVKPQIGGGQGGEAVWL